MTLKFSKDCLELLPEAQRLAIAKCFQEILDLKGNLENKVEEMCDLMDFPGYLVGVVDDEELNMYPDEEPKYYSSIGDYIRTLM